MTSFTWCCSLVLALLIFGPRAQASLSATEVARQSEEATRVKGYQAEAKLTTTTAADKGKIKEFKMWRQLQADLINYNTMTRFHKPSSIKDEGVLILEREGDASDVLLYLPRFKKIRRVENSNQSGSFMGSAFSYADIAPSHYTDLNLKLLANESCPVGEGECYVLRGEGKTPQVKRRSGYDYTKTWINTKTLLTMRIEGYSKEGKRIRRVDFGKYASTDGKGGANVAQEMSAIRDKDGLKTQFQILDLKVDERIKGSLFTRENLENP
ncbi:MAG: outer membrane lipoprotein-sorting protein [Bdellovibrionales bacterium]|nr:outer membrane lipoprotein-sorting protein [Bdellovibrionales bacterium]